MTRAMEEIRIEVGEVVGLSPSTNRELKPKSPLKRRGIDEVCHQNSDRKKRRRSSRSSIDFISDDENDPRPSKRQKLPPRFQRHISLSTPQQSAQPACQIWLPPPVSPPIRQSGRPKEPKLLWAKWRPSNRRRRSNAQKTVNRGAKQVNLKELKVKSISKTFSPTKGSFAAKSIKDESLKCSPLPDLETKIKTHISAHPESPSHTKPLQPNMNQRDISRTLALPNTTNAAPSSQVDQEPASTNTMSKFVDATNKPSQSKRPRSSHEEPDNDRPRKNLRSTYFSQVEIDTTAELLINLSVLCSENRNPDRATLQQLHDLLKDLPAPLNNKAYVTDPEEFIAFRAALNRHELAANWGHLDSFVDLKCEVSGKLQFEPRLAEGPKPDGFGNFVV